MALTYSWNTINASQCDADSPLDEVLMEAIRQNLIHLEEWLGQNYTAASDHDHNGANSKIITNITDAQLANSSAGNIEINSNDIERIAGEVGYTLKKETRIVRGGTFRIKFSIRGDSGFTYYGQIYRNGVAVGTERTTTSGTYVEFSEDIAGWSPNDRVQIYSKKGTGAYSTYVCNFRIYAAIAIETIPTAGY